MDYFLILDSYNKFSLSDFSKTLNSFPKKRVGSVTIEELCAIDEYPNGLYLFFNNENELWYVGKATSRSFIERIPAHFDQREIAWFNTLPKKVMKFCNIQTYREALNKALSLKLMIIGIQDKNTAIKLETVLRSYLQPKLNSCKGNYEPAQLIENFIEKLVV